MRIATLENPAVRQSVCPSVRFCDISKKIYSQLEDFQLFIHLIPEAQGPKNTKPKRGNGNRSPVDNILTYVVRFMNLCKLHINRNIDIDALNAFSSYLLIEI